MCCFPVLIPTKSSTIPHGNPFQGQIHPCWLKRLHGICQNGGKTSPVRRKPNLSFQVQLLVEIFEVWKVWSQFEGYHHPCLEPFSLGLLQSKAFLQQHKAPNSLGFAKTRESWISLKKSWVLLIMLNSLSRQTVVSDKAAGLWSVLLSPAGTAQVNWKY